MIADDIGDPHPGLAFCSSSSIPDQPASLPSRPAAGPTACIFHVRSNPSPPVCDGQLPIRTDR